MAASALRDRRGPRVLPVRRVRQGLPDLRVKLVPRDFRALWDPPGRRVLKVRQALVYHPGPCSTSSTARNGRPGYTLLGNFIQLLVGKPPLAIDVYKKN